MRIAVDANVLAIRQGGIPRYLLRIVERLAAAGDDVHLLANRRSWEPPVPGVHAVGLRLKGLDLWRAAAVPAWVVARRADVLWAPETVLPWHVVGAATVSTVHDLAPLIFPDSKSSTVLRQFHTSFPRSVRSATRVICVSERTARDVERIWGVEPERVRVVHNGVDAIFMPGLIDAARAEVEARHDLSGPYVLHVGSLEPRKGLDVLIEAAARRPGWRLVLAGAPAHDGERLVAAAERAGALLVSEPSDEALLALYRGALAVAAPAIYEGFGIVPLEAMACGTPAVIAAGAGALEDVSGPAAVVVFERTPEAWIAAIDEAAGRRTELAALGIAHAAAFSWDDAASRTRAVLLEAVSAR